MKDNVLSNYRCTICIMYTACRQSDFNQLNKSNTCTLTRKISYCLNGILDYIMYVHTCEWVVYYILGYLVFKNTLTYLLVQRRLNS